MQKLDLLIHLITNLRQSLVICGASGIGKTSLLNALQKRKKDSWIIINVPTSENLSFEAVQDQLQRFIVQENAEYKNYNLSSILSVLDKQGQKIVLILDDAGSLVPGLIGSLIQYADASTCLRVVFSITHDDLQVKNSSDRTIDSCHFIEIPPLTEMQCGAFLQNLSAKPEATISLNAINDSLVEKLYKETHGIPGEIISALPNISNYRSANGIYWLSAMLVVSVVIGSVFFLFGKQGVEQKQQHVNLPITLSKPEHVEISSPVLSPGYQTQDEKTDEAEEVIIENRVGDVLITNIKLEIAEEVKEIKSPLRHEKSKNHVEETGKDRFEEVKIENINGVSSTSITVDTIVAEVKEIKKEIPVVLTKPEQLNNTFIKKVPKTEVDDRQWILKQPHKNRTIQLMALSTRKAVLDFLGKNQGLKENVKFLRVTTQDKEKYLVLYGTFGSQVIAAKEMKKLPAKYKKSWIRKFRDLQKIIK